MAERIGQGRSSRERRIVATILFVDLCSSTRLAAALDPDPYAALLEGFRETVAKSVLAHGGEVAQYYGDGVMAVFGHRPSHASDILDAVAAARAASAVLDAIPVPAPAQGPLRVHCGVHSGLVLCRRGNALRGHVEVIGRATAVAARLSAAAGRGEILVSAQSLGPERRRLSLGPLRAVDIGDGSGPLAAFPVTGPGDPETGASRVRAEVPLVGRERLLDELERRLAPQAGPGPVRLRLCGPPGQGKTRIAEALAARLEARGLAVLMASCRHGRDAGPLLPFRALGPAVGAGTPAGADFPQRFAAAFGAWAAARASLLVIDDWQWADTASLVLLGSLRREASAGLLLLERDGEAPPRPMPGFTDLALPPLDAGESLALVHHVRPELTPLDASRIHRLSGGNPLLVLELSAIDRASLERLGPARPAIEELAWLAASLSLRSATLPPAARRLLEIAIVAGPAPPLWLIEALSGRRPSPAQIAALETRNLAFASGATLRFSHGITHDLLYTLLPPDTRRSWHEAIAARIEAQPDMPGIDRDEALAWHYAQSDQPGRAWLCARTAGDRAAAAGALDQAQLRYRAAIEAIEALAPVDELEESYWDLVDRFGMSCVFDSDDRHLPVFTRARAVAEARGRVKESAKADFWAGFVLHGSGRHRDAVRTLERALARTDQPAGSPFVVQLRATLGQAHAGAGQYGSALPLLEDAIAIKRRFRTGRQASVGLSYTLACYAAALGDLGRFDEAHAAIDEALAVLQAESHAVEGSIMAWSAAIHGWAGDWEGALATAERGQSLAVRNETTYLHGICRAIGGYARWRLDRSPGGADDLRSAVGFLEQHGKYLGLSICYGYRAELEAELGERQAARVAIACALMRARHGDVLGVAAAARVAALLESGRPGRALAWLRTASTNAAQRESSHERARCDLAAALLARAADPAEAIAGWAGWRASPLTRPLAPAPA